ncbi:hypothetical protein U9M48_009751 [Paspalum notatum var. saurae]|uniref:Uncharacterized protein n=1 Tax=Paspalum notatum var. saurae TaxID=547442 RepID=A0AAQ3WFF3_PASNO
MPHHNSSHRENCRAPRTTTPVPRSPHPVAPPSSRPAVQASSPALARVARTTTPSRRHAAAPPQASAFDPRQREVTCQLKDGARLQPPVRRPRVASTSAALCHGTRRCKEQSFLLRCYCHLADSCRNAAIADSVRRRGKRELRIDSSARPRGWQALPSTCPVSH